MKAYSTRYRFAAQALAGAGHDSRRIGRLLGVPYTTVYRWLNADYAARQRARSADRKNRYRGWCVDCGAPTAWGGATTGGKPSKRCRSCRKALEQSADYRAEHTVWTKDRVVLAIREWAQFYGEPPAAADWDPWRARVKLGDEMRARRFERDRGRWPSFIAAVDRFGSWNAALEAAGFAGRCNTGGCGNSLRRRTMRAKLEQPT